uniref:Uncharacterized protein n=1 Tax=uncultured bacterium W4-87b TaxID=1130995 RepID=H9BWT9_9BACT|nr:hypothetical protein [uncultured bacterium W4-87b]
MKLADLTSHHIEGMSLHGDTPFKIPLFSHIEGNLWMGGCPVKVAPEEFEYIVSLHPWESYTIAEFQVHTLNPGVRYCEESKFAGKLVSFLYETIKYPY